MWPLLTVKPLKAPPSERQGWRQPRVVTPGGSAIPPPTSSTVAPFEMIAPLIMAPNSMISVPPALTKLLLAVAPNSTTSTPPLLTVVLVSSPPLAISSDAALDGPVGGAGAGDRPGAADHVEGGEAEVLRPDRAEIERIGAAPAELEGVLAGRIDGTADAVAGAEREGVAAAGELDRRAAGADDDRPPSKMLTEWALLIKMPAEPETTPKLEMPPVKVGPAMSIAVLLERTSLARSIRMPWLVALMLPLSRIAPLMVLANRAMPVLAVMEPELTILPTTLETPNALVVDLPNSMPICPALIEPLLLRPPRKVRYAADDDAVAVREGITFRHDHVGVDDGSGDGISLDDDALRRRYRAAVDDAAAGTGAAEHRGAAALADRDAGSQRSP